MSKHTIIVVQALLSACLVYSINHEEEMIHDVVNNIYNSVGIFNGRSHTWYSSNLVSVQYRLNVLNQNYVCYLMYFVSVRARTPFDCVASL